MVPDSKIYDLQFTKALDPQQSIVPGLLLVISGGFLTFFLWARILFIKDLGILMSLYYDIIPAIAASLLFIRFRSQISAWQFTMLVIVGAITAPLVNDIVTTHFLLPFTGVGTIPVPGLPDNLARGLGGALIYILVCIPLILIYVFSAFLQTRYTVAIILGFPIFLYLTRFF